MVNSVIISEVSEVSNNNIFIAIINGTNSASFDIYCNETDICDIRCESYESCQLLNLYCFGTCFINDTLPMPTEYPTLTMYPTQYPTGMEIDISTSVMNAINPTSMNNVDTTNAPNTGNMEGTSHSSNIPTEDSTDSSESYKIMANYIFWVFIAIRLFNLI